MINTIFQTSETLATLNFILLCCLKLENIFILLLRVTCHVLSCSFQRRRIVILSNFDRRSYEIATRSHKSETVNLTFNDRTLSRSNIRRFEAAPVSFFASYIWVILDFWLNEKSVST